MLLSTRTVPHRRASAAHRRRLATCVYGAHDCGRSSENLSKLESMWPTGSVPVKPDGWVTER